MQLRNERRRFESKSKLETSHEQVISELLLSLTTEQRGRAIDSAISVFERRNAEIPANALPALLKHASYLMLLNTESINSELSRSLKALLLIHQCSHQELEDKFVDCGKSSTNLFLSLFHQCDDAACVHAISVMTSVTEIILKFSRLGFVKVRHVLADNSELLETLLGIANSRWLPDIRANALGIFCNLACDEQHISKIAQFPSLLDTLEEIVFTEDSPNVHKNAITLICNLTLSKENCKVFSGRSKLLKALCTTISEGHNEDVKQKAVWSLCMIFSKADGWVSEVNVLRVLLQGLRDDEKMLGVELRKAILQKFAMLSGTGYVYVMISVINFFEMLNALILSTNFGDEEDSNTTREEGKVVECIESKELANIVKILTRACLLFKNLPDLPQYKAFLDCLTNLLLKKYKMMRDKTFSQFHVSWLLLHLSQIDDAPTRKSICKHPKLLRSLVSLLHKNNDGTLKSRASAVLFNLSPLLFCRKIMGKNATLLTALVEGTKDSVDVELFCLGTLVNLACCEVNRVRMRNHEGVLVVFLKGRDGRFDLGIREILLHLIGESPHKKRKKKEKKILNKL